MNLFTRIDWQNLKNILNEIEQIAYNFHQEDAKDKIALTERFYQIEKDLATVKKQLQLPQLNASIDSESVLKSFSETPTDKDIFDKENTTYNNYLRQNDYQYWLLIYLLLKNNSIREKNLTLYEIIDGFINRVKDTSFTWRDIEFTGSGATRARTNLRFAYDDLKKAGLVNLYDSNHKTSWTLTYLGFFTATSFCLNQVDNGHSPFSKKVTRFHQSTYYFRLNKFIWERISELSNPHNLNSLIAHLQLESLSLKELKKGAEIFGEYYSFVFSLQKKYSSEIKREKALSEYLKLVNEKHSLTAYMKELSLKFDAEAFFRELINKVNNKK